jgi:enoyl-CoA hydratase/carnithine racemase
MFTLAIEDHVARLTIDRPATRNAIPLAGWDAVGAKLDEAVAAGAHLLVLAGAGGAFCAGADLGEFPESEPGRLRKAMRRALGRLETLAIPTIAAIGGPCYGAGVALALACDIRLAGPEARFAITPAKIGISFPQEDVHALVAAVGPGQAARLLYTGGAIDGAEALRIGLADAGLAALDETVAAIRASDPASLETLKRGVALARRGVISDEAQDRTFDALLRAEELVCRLAKRRKA